MKTTQHKLLNQIENLQQEIQKYPNGELFLSKSRGYYNWRLKCDGRKYYLPRNKISLARELCQKKLLTAQLSDAQKELSAINHYLSVCPEEPSEKERIIRYLAPSGLLNEMHTRNEKIHAWEAEGFSEMEKHSDQLKIRTLRGHKVRSKSEQVIADSLYAKHIPYRYEYPMVLGSNRFLLILRSRIL